MTSTDARPRCRGWRWLRRLAIGLVVVGLLLAFGGWLRGQDQWGPFRGQVVDAETGAPIANANVMVSWGFRRFGELMLRNFDAARDRDRRAGTLRTPPPVAALVRGRYGTIVRILRARLRHTDFRG